MIDIEVLSDEIKWSQKIKKKKRFFQLICKSFPKRYKFVNKRVSLTLLLSNNQSIKRLNKKFRNKNRPTDILSFPLKKGNTIKKNDYLGDIIISFDFIDKPKSQSKKIFREKVIKTFIHGFLHLQGFDHINLGEYKKMLEQEEKIYNSVIEKIY